MDKTGDEDAPPYWKSIACNMHVPSVVCMITKTCM